MKRCVVCGTNEREKYDECLKNFGGFLLDEEPLFNWFEVPLLEGFKVLDMELLNTHSSTIGTTKDALKVFDNPSSIDDLENIDEDTMKRIMDNTNCKIVLKVEDQKMGVDRLAELEEQILQYYLSQGYKLFKDPLKDGSENWSFKVEITSGHKYKGLGVFLNDSLGIRPCYVCTSETTKEMFDKAFEFFKVEGV